jgi:hypothetical protein
MGQISTMKTNSKRIMDIQLATWNVRSLYRPGGHRIMINEPRKYKIAKAAIKEMRWKSSGIIMNSWSKHTQPTQVMTWSWPGNRKSANDRQTQLAWEYKWKWPQTGRLCRRQANGNQKYVLHAQANPTPNLALPHRSLLDRRKTLFWRHRCYGAEGCKHHFRPHGSRYKIGSKNIPGQQQLRRFAVDRLKDRDVASRYSKVCTLNH